jgi:hypothetical protein
MPASLERAAHLVALPARAAARQLRDWSPDAIDDWGRDPGLAHRVARLGELRWHVEVGGVEHLPARSGALIVINARRLALAPLMAALALSDAVERPVRFVGRPDVAPLGPLLQRLGGLVPQPAEVAGALRAGELVVLGARHHPSRAVAGTLDRAVLAAAISARVRVYPTAVLSSPASRAARVEVAAPVRPDRIRRGPLAEVELAEVVERRLDELLSEMGGSLTGTPLDWWPLSKLLSGWRD